MNRAIRTSKKRSVVSPDSSVKKVKLEELEQKVEQVVHSRTAILEGIQKLLEDDGVATTEGVPDELTSSVCVCGWQDLRLRLVEWRDRLRETRYALQENERKYAEEQELSHTEVNSFRDLYEAAKTKAENLSKEMEALDAIHKARLNSEAEAVQKARDELATMEQTMREVREAKELEMQSFAECLQESEQQRMLLETEKAEQLRLLEGEAGQLRRQLDEFKMVKRDLQAAMMALDARNTALGNLTNELRDVKNEMQSLREDTGIQIRERDEQIESFRVLLEEREAKIKGLQQDMAIAHSCVEQLDEKLDISKQLEYSLNVEMQRLQDELAEADQVKQILENLKQVLNDREAENARLLSQLTEAQHRIKSLVDELSTKESLLRSLSAERDELKDHTVPELKGKLADAESMAVDLQSKYVDSEARWQSLSQEAGGLNIQLAELQAVRGNLEEAMRTMNKEHGELSAKLSHTQNQLKLLSDDSNNRDHKIGDLSEKILYLQDELRTKETTITTLEQSIRAANALVDDTKRIANERMEEIEAVIEAKIMEVETAEQDVQTLQTKYHDSEAELERMRRQLVENEDEIYVFQRQIEQQQSLLMEKELGYAEQIEAMKGEHGRHVQELEVVTEDLRKKLSDAGEQTKSLLQEVSELQEKIVIFERSRNELHNTVTALEQTAFEANVLARSTRDDANRRIEELDMAMKDKDTALSAVEDKNILLEKQYLEVSSEIQRLYRQLADTECELQALREAGQRNDASRTEQETTYLEQLASLRAEHARMIQEKDQAIFDLTKKLDVFDEQVQALVEEAEDLHHQLEDYQKTKQEYTVMVNELEEVHKGIQSLEAVTRTVEEEKTAMEIMFNQRIQELQIEKNNVIEVLKRDHQNIIEDWHRRIEDVQGQLTEANKELEVKISQQQEIGARFERGEYIDIGELEKLKAGMQTKWDDEKITLKDEIESGRKALETMASRLDGMKQELVAAVRYGQDFDSKIEAGDYIRREDVSTLKTSWLEEQSELQTKIQNLDGELKATHTFLEETKKEVQVKDNQLLEIALHFQNGKFVDVEKLKKLEADLNERWEVERTELENALEVCKQDLKMTEGHLKSVQEKFEVMIKKEKDMAVKIEQGHYIDAVKVMQIQAEFESKWESERNILEVKLEKEAGELVSTKTMLEHAQTQIMLLKGREEEVASRIVSGDLIEKAKFEYLKAEMVMDWEREKAVNESLTEKLCIIQTSMEESKNEMELKERQMQEITTRLQKSNELTIQELTRVNTEAKKNWESQRAELEKIISQSESKYKVQHAEFEAAKRELQQKSLAIEKLSVECEKQKALFSKEQKTSLQRIQELESRSDDISRSSVDSNRKITQLRQQLHQRESEVQELLKRIEQHENKVSKDNHDNLIELQTAEKAETKSKEFYALQLMMLTSLQAEVAKLTVEKENLGKQINTQRMIAENGMFYFDYSCVYFPCPPEITKYKHLEATHEKLIADSFKLKKENERLLEETTSKTDRRIPEEAATLQSKRKHERTRDKEKDNGADDRLVTKTWIFIAILTLLTLKDDRENAGHTNMVCNKTGKSLDVKTVDVTETRLPLIDVNAPKSSARRQRMLNRQIKTDENGNKGKESAECNQQ
ncbi:hypothetical protein BC937DRAFT_87663 [Endogone sp. FLAS-F59071]|nr:hypothetical protein BC937DRAFT_87663 [Endogone sp. FLAS-F59071]|eukprot:RUS19324.1 hypothetical protein BC937DRAFT_87663 [Endogone sp. FLAS-F59071]